jgi:replication factor C subunit 1
MKKELWSDKYKPNSLDNLFGNSKNIQQITKWVEDLTNGKNTKPILLLYGKPGIGKTTVAYLILKKFNYDIIEYNASDCRSQKTVKNILSHSLNTLNINIMDDKNKNKKIAIIMDEIDGMSSGDKGGMKEFIGIIKSFKNKKIQNPIICICNNHTEKKIQTLKLISKEISFNRPTTDDILALINKIEKNEKMNMEDDAKQLIVEHCQYDFRKLTYIMQDLYNVYKRQPITDDMVSINLSNILKKNIDIELFGAVNQLMSKYTNLDTSIQLFDTDRGLVSMMIHENFIKVVNLREKDKDKRIDLLYNIYKYIELGDIIERYIHSNQCWKLQYYNGILNCSYPSFLINQLKPVKLYHDDIKYTTVLSRYASLGNNNNYHRDIKSKIRVNSKYILSFSNVMLQHLTYDETEKAQKLITTLPLDDLDSTATMKPDKNSKLKGVNTKNKNILSVIKHYGFEIADVEKFIKINRIFPEFVETCKHFTKTSTRKKLEKMFGTVPKDIKKPKKKDMKKDAKKDAKKDVKKDAKKDTKKDAKNTKGTKLSKATTKGIDKKLKSKNGTNKTKAKTKTKTKTKEKETETEETEGIEGTKETEVSKPKAKIKKPRKTVTRKSKKKEDDFEDLVQKKSINESAIFKELTKTNS